MRGQKFRAPALFVQLGKSGHLTTTFSELSKYHPGPHFSGALTRCPLQWSALQGPCPPRSATVLEGPRLARARQWICGGAATLIGAPAASVGAPAA
jgi:hypothetical protein